MQRKAIMSLNPRRPRAARLISPAFFLASLLLAGGCGSGKVPDEPLGTPAPPPTRPSDRLLESRELQRVVDLQVARDGRGLLDLLASEDALVRARSAYALASVQDPEAGPTLLALLRDATPAVRRDAAFALGQLGDSRFGPALLGALRDESDMEVRVRLLEALGKVGDETALEALTRIRVSQEEEGPRNLALSRMGVRGITLPTGILLLVKELKAGDEGARVSAAYYFGRSSAPGPWAGQADAVRAVLDSLPPEDGRSMHLLVGLSTLGDPQDTPRLLWWLSTSQDWRVRANAARGLSGRAADPRVRMALLEAMDDPSTHVAIQAANALAGAQQIPPREREALRGWVEDHPGEWRRVGPILSLLGRMGEGEFLTKWLQQWGEEDYLPRTRGLGALAFVPGEDATVALMDAAGSANSRIRGTALGGLARRWRVDRQDPATHARYFETFARGLRTGDPAASYVAAPALADSAFIPLGSVELLIQEFRRMSLPDGLEGMQAILGALAETGAPEAEGFLLEVVDGSQGALRTSASGALSRLRGEDRPSAPGAERAERTVDWEALARLGPRPRMILETEKGRVILVLDAESAPLTVQTMAGFAQEGRFDGVPFHRVVPNFVAQGGDFARQDGFGGPGFNIRSEFTQISFERGVVGMASAGKDTEGSQFFITHSPQPHLDGSYTAFGWVEEGMDVVDRIYEEDKVLTARVEPTGF